MSYTTLKQKAEVELSAEYTNTIMFDRRKTAMTTDVFGM